jgi:hypothetical protein
MAEVVQLPFDIIDPVMPPAPPLDSTWIVVAASMAALVLAALIWVYWRRTRQRRLARKQLSRARQAFVAGALAEHEAAYAIADALRAGWGVRQVAATDNSDQRWQAFIQRLDRMRYSASSTDAAMADLFAEAAFWLRGKSQC